MKLNGEHENGFLDVAYLSPGQTHSKNYKLHIKIQLKNYPNSANRANKYFTTLYFQTKIYLEII